MNTNARSAASGSRGRPASRRRPQLDAKMYRRLAGAYFTMANMAKELADAAEWIAEHELGNKRPSTEAAAFEARSDAHEPEQRDGRDAQPSADATDAEQRQKDKRLARRRRQSERLAAERQTRTATQAAPVAAVDGEDAMEIAGCDEEAEQAAAPLVELDHAAADSNCGKSAVTGAGEVGTLVPAVPTAEVEPEVMEEDDENGDDDFKVGDVVVYCGVRNEWADDDFVEPGDVGSVIGPSYDDDEDWWVPVKFPHSEFDCRGGCLRLYTEGKQKAIEDGLQPKRLYSDIDHTGESPGPPESKKAQQAKQDHGQADGGHEAKSQDYGTRFVNGNKGVG